MKKHALWLEIGIIILIVALSLASYFIFFHNTEPGSSIVIEGDNVNIAEYPLDVERLILIKKGSDGRFSVSEISSPYSEKDFGKNYNLIQIKDGSVRVISADCPASGATKCTNQGSKAHSGDSVVCLEHGVIITVVGGESGELDFVAR